MKKIFIIAALASLVVVGCKKKENNVSMLVTASTPVVTITGSLYYSIPVGGSLPNISAVAYDTFYKDSLPVIIDQGTLDNTTPGLYTVLVTAKNKYGYVGSANVYIGVTNVSSALDLTGWYVRNGNPTGSSYVQKQATGMFTSSNVGGVDTVAAPYAVVAGVFVVTSDSTIDFGSQATSSGTLTAADESLSLAPGDTTLTYRITSPSSIFSTTTVRVLVKQ